MRAGDGTTNDTPPRLRASARINLLRAWWLRSWTPAFAGERLGAGRMRASPRPRLLYDAGVTASSDAARALNARSALPLNCVTDAIERSEEHTSELQSLMRISYAVFCLKKKNNNTNTLARS